MKLIKQTAFVAVDVKDELPNNEIVHVIEKNGRRSSDIIADQNSWYNGRKRKWISHEDDDITHWLKEKDNVYVLSEDELKELKDTLHDIDFALSQMEDYLHGNDGKKITEMRQKLQQLNLSNNE